MSDIEYGMKDRCESFDFCESITSNRSNSIDEGYISSGPDSRSNSISENDSQITSQYRRTGFIPVPNKQSKHRKREINYDGSSAHDVGVLTPTPSKYYKMMIENYERLQEFISPKK